MVNPIVHRRLVEAARARWTVTVAEVAQAAGLSAGADDRKMLDLILDHIADREAGGGRPLLPVLVVETAGRSPGAGLARYARRTGLAAAAAFLSAELARVHAHWGSP